MNNQNNMHNVESGACKPLGMLLTDLVFFERLFKSECMSLLEKLLNPSVENLIL